MSWLRAILWFVGLGRPREGDEYESTHDGRTIMTVNVLAVAEDAAVVTIWTLGGTKADGLHAIPAGRWREMLRTLRLRRVPR